ncbi:protein of unknown function [Ruminococcaceae bacterium BL-6]|nr:protein of unknown function [Ruminococcaceae bacterium BL-6]
MTAGTPRAAGRRAAEEPGAPTTPGMETRIVMTMTTTTTGSEALGASAVSVDLAAVPAVSAAAVAAHAAEAPEDEAKFYMRSIVLDYGATKIRPVYRNHNDYGNCNWLGDLFQKR